MKRKKSFGKTMLKNAAIGAKIGMNILHPDPIGMGLDKLSSIQTTTTHGAVRGKYQKLIKIGNKIRYAKYNEKDERIAIKQTPGKWKNVRMKRKPR